MNDQIIAYRASPKSGFLKLGMTWSTSTGVALSDRAASADNAYLQTLTRPSNPQRVHTSLNDGGLRPTNRVPQLDLDEEDHTEELHPAIDTETKDQIVIEYKSLTWQQAAYLLSLIYIAIPLFSLPSSVGSSFCLFSTFATLGIALGCICSIGIGLICIYTTHLLWRYCMLNPGVENIVDIGYLLFGKSRIAYEITAFGFVSNAALTAGYHCIAAAVAFNTLTEHGLCTAALSAMSMAIMFTFSLFRRLNTLSYLGIFAALTMMTSAILLLIFGGVQSGPVGWANGDNRTITAWPTVGFISVLNAILNIVFNYTGQAFIPSIIVDMAKPQDFPKALYLVGAVQITMFTLVGCAFYIMVGNEYMQGPAYMSLQPLYAKIVAAFTLPTVLLFGCFAADVSARFIFFRVFSPASVHRRTHTVKGWACWVALLTVIWSVAWIASETIPIFNEITSVIGAVFNSWFGLLFWGLAFGKMYAHDRSWLRGLRKIEAFASTIAVLLGFLCFGGGLATSSLAIKNSYDTGRIKGIFTCANNGYDFE